MGFFVLPKEKLSTILFFEIASYIMYQNVKEDSMLLEKERDCAKELSW